MALGEDDYNPPELEELIELVNIYDFKISPFLMLHARNIKLQNIGGGVLDIERTPYSLHCTIIRSECVENYICNGTVRLMSGKGISSDIIAEITYGDVHGTQ